MALQALVGRPPALFDSYAAIAALEKPECFYLIKTYHLRWYYSQCLRLPSYFADWTIASVPSIPKSHGNVAYNQLNVQEKGFGRL